MLNAWARQKWLFPLGMALLSAGFFHLSVLGLFFLVPLQLVKSRYGSGIAIVVALVVTAMIAGSLAVGLTWQLSQFPWLFVEIKGLSLFDELTLGFAGLLIGGWVLTWLLEVLHWRFLVRISVALALVGVVFFSSSWLLMGNLGFQNHLDVEFLSFWKKLLIAGSSVGPGSLASLVPPDWIKNPIVALKAMEEAILGTVLLSFFAVWLVTWRVVRSSVGRRFLLRNFRLPSAASLVLLGSWALFLGGSLLTQNGHDYLGFWNYVISNVAWITLVIHVLAGWGIVQSLLERWCLPLLLRGLILAVLAFFCFWVGSVAEVATLVGLTALAVLELWINFRNYHVGSEEIL